MQEYYKILGVSEKATEEQINEAYNKLKAKYSEERFCEGEVGNKAAKNLTKLELAYSEILNSKNKKSDIGGEKMSVGYAQVEKLIREGKISEAQQTLDDILERDAEWHYLQSVIFYKKNWVNESKKQLEIALSIEPRSEKYGEAYARLKQKIDYNQNQFHSGNSNYDNYNNANNVNNRQMGGSSNDCLTFCATWCCMDMLCSMCCR